MTPEFQTISAFSETPSEIGTFDPVTRNQMGTPANSFVYVENIFLPAAINGTYVVAINQDELPRPVDDMFALGIFLNDFIVDLIFGRFFAGSTEQHQVYYIAIPDASTMMV